MPLVPSPGVVRAGQLLSRLATQPTRAFSVSELARHVGIPRATCDSLLQGLADGGFVQRDRALGYRLGSACIALGDAARAANPALQVAEAEADRLARAQSSTVAVTVRDGHETRVAFVADHGPPFGIRPRAGDAIALVPPFGASFVAWDDAEHIAAWLGRAEPGLTTAERRRYHAALEAVKQRGYSVTVSPGLRTELASALERLLPGTGEAEAAPDRRRDEAIRTVTHSDYLASELAPTGSTRLTQISAPVFQANGDVAASLMVLGPGHEVTAADIAGLGSALADAAARATQQLAARPGPPARP